MNFNSFINRADYSIKTNQRFAMKDRYYEDKDGFIATKATVVIPSDIITDKVLKVRLPLYENYNQILKYTCPLFNGNSTLQQDSSSANFNTFSDGYKFGQSLGRTMRGGSGRSLIPGEDSIMVRCFLEHLQLDLDGVPVEPENAMIGAARYGSPLPELITYFPLQDIPPGMHRLHLRMSVKSDDPESPEDEFEYRDHIIPFFYAPE